MYIILVYDVNIKVNRRVATICKKYLIRVQKSVFEGFITKSKLNKMMYELEKIINFKRDSIIIYSLNSLKYISKLELGYIKENNKVL